MRKIILSTIGVLFIIGCVLLSKNIIANKTKPKPIVKKTIKSVFIDTVQNTEIPIVVPANGSLVAKERIELYAEVQGVLKLGKKLFKTGEVYQKGETLIQIDAGEFKANVQASKSLLYNNIAAIMPDLRLDFPEVYQKWQDYLSNFNMEKPAPALPKMDSEKENYFIVGRGIVSSYYSLKNLEQRLSKYKITAPFTGILTEALATEGSLIRSNQKLGEFINPSIYEMQVSISKSFANILKTGEKVALTNLDKTENYEGVITRINGSIDPTTQTLSVFIEVKNADLKEGIYLEALINAKKVNNAIELNRNLLLEGNEIFSVVNGKLEKIAVSPVYFSDTKVVLQNIANGTVILSSPISGAYAGMLVKPFNKTEE
ncbi:multidrug efflux pump subunit AcrA (membrane-fusion protein) [Wenyingzhuangia heitensis]|uniref:Multidrug efflux pump subunit AcrA (Membrane-fusion protein) n=1 Tax=Wenyingzhuangia heitensis TaxID=1487859 RepID=A0ABX0UFM3_9FLAO|nr:HlyD family efflux transporter periplasmic adaptor subunit [Wenyingzhuangia heitensis]NIJ46341.1 multidrug efflux pump subunit AcrA (membrane-fusion protein) [Wenyingzhuangia heitensis]